MTLGGRSTQFVMPPRSPSILEAARAVRPEVPYSCTNGVCGTCRCRVVTGSVEMTQNFALEGLLFPLIYDKLTDRLNAAHGPVLSMLTRFQREWFTENVKWVDASLKVAAAESADNRHLLAGWAASWTARAAEALAPIAARFSDGSGDAHLAAVRAALDERIRKLGLAQA